MNPTQRTFTDVETSQKFRLYTNSDNNKYSLISDPTDKPQDLAGGSEVNGFYICSHAGVTIKINSSKVIELNQGTFYNLKDGEVITHKKFTGFKRFTRVND